MSAPPPRTPSRTPARRLIPSGSRPTTPTSPALVRSRVRSEASASPQVKAALALLRKNRPTPSPAIDPDQLDPFTTPVKGSRAGSRMGEKGAGESGADGGEEVGLEWGMRSMAVVVEGAKRSGRLNIASRTLVAIPPSAYAALIPINSSYHPSSKAPPTSRITTVNLTISSALEDAAAETTAWYEQTDLISLNAANNEVVVLEDAIAGFDALEILDLHNNYLASVPISLAFLDNLTSLNLASNHLTSFPTQILALSSLRDLNLSSNPIRTLWTPDWRTHLNDTVRPPNASPSASPQSDASPDPSNSGFWGSLSSSPTKQASGSDAISYRSTAPFPALTTLLLADNSFDADTFTAEGLELPPRLLSLDLSNNGLGEASLPLDVFGRLERLTTLNLAGNDITDNLFPSPPPIDDLPLLFASLRTLDLSRNSIDSLATLEQTLLTRVARPIEWIGLPRPIANLVRAAAASHKLPTTPTTVPAWEGVEVNVTANPLGLEHARRRSAFPPSVSTPVPASALRKATNGKAPEPETPTATVVPVVEQAVAEKGEKVVLEKGKVVPEKEAWEIEAESGLLTEGGRRRARAEAARRAREEEEEERQEDVVVEEPDVDAVVEGVQALELASMKEPTTTTTATPSPATTPDRSPSPSPLPSSPSPYPSQESPPPPPSTASAALVAEADSTDPAVVLVASGFKASNQSLVLASQSLSSLPIPTTGSPPSSLTNLATLDLSRNAFTSLPLSSIGSWNWASSLRSLDLAHNTLSTIELLSHPDLRLPSLATLDLSWNHLASTIVVAGPSAPLLSLLATIAPSLEDLDLSYNRLTTTEGISMFLLPSAGGAGGRRLSMRGNQLADVEELCEVAKALENGASGTSWRCVELDLQDNEIARLPPTLGFLPPEVQLLVAGNRFRIPRREVYIDGGSKGLLQYLRDRA